VRLGFADLHSLQYAEFDYPDAKVEELIRE
jgi:hypothetical protein